MEVQTENENEFTVFLNVLGDSSSINAKAAAAGFFRRLASNGSRTDFPFEDCRTLVRRLLALLRMDPVKKSDLSVSAARLDAAWSITNLACLSPEVCHIIVAEGALPVLAETASKERKGSELKLQCYWAIGNIAADCGQCKTAARTTDIIEQMAQSLDICEFRPRRDWKNVVWSTLNIVRGGIHTISIEGVAKIVQSCTRILVSPKREGSDTKSVITDCLWVIASLADDMQNAGLQTDIVCSEPMLIDKVMNLLYEGDEAHYHGCLRLLGNIATGNDNHTEFITRHPLFYDNVVKSLDGSAILQHEAAWLCSNVAAAREDLIEVLYTDNRLYDRILRGAREGTNKLKKECLWTLLNMVMGSSEERVEWLVATGVVSVFPSMIAMRDRRVVSRGLQTVLHILHEFPHFAAMVDEQKLLEKIDPTFVAEDVNVRHNCEELKRILREQLAGTSNEEGTYYFD